jgi:predicted ATPase/DNA-binding CsgD family transcriptional regulator
MGAPRRPFDPTIGREAEILRVERLLQEHRLVTLVGPGGIGKTRLARTILANQSDRALRTGFVGAAGLGTSQQVVPAMAEALGLEGTASARPADLLARAFAGKDGLVVLDELDGLDDPGPTVAQILAGAANLRIVATSRVPLEVRSGHEVRLTPLAVPWRDDPGAVMASPAVELFLTRARAVGYEPGDDPASILVIGRLVRDLDGMPLAVELAAARTRVLSPREILERIDAGGLASIESPSDAPARSMTSIVAWTLGLVRERDRSTLDAAAICHGFDLPLLGAMLPGSEIADSVEALVTAGVIHEVEPRRAPRRFGMLSTIRAAVMAKMPPATEDVLRDAHATAMLDRASAEDARSATDPAEAIRRLSADGDNLRSAQQRWLATSLDGACSMYVASRRFWRSGHRSQEAVAAFRAIEAAHPAPTVELSRALHTYADLAWGAVSPAEAMRANQAALQLSIDVGDTIGVVEGLEGCLIGQSADPDPDALADVRRRLASIESPTPASRELDAAIAGCEALLVALETGTRSDATLQATQQARDAARGVDPVREMVAQGDLAFAHLMRGEYEAVRDPIASALGLAAALRHGRRVSYLATGIEAAARRREPVDPDRLRELIEALEDLPPLDIQVAAACRAVAAVLVEAANPLDAARTAGAFEAIATARPDLPLRDDRWLVERILAVARRQARGIDVVLAVRDGAAARPVDLLRAVVGRLASGGRDNPTAPSGGPRLRHGELTRREIQVLTLIGHGRTDQEIADALSISPKTVSVHVSNIKGKLALDSRLGVALHARDLGLR